MIHFLRSSQRIINPALWGFVPKPPFTTLRFPLECALIPLANDDRMQKYKVETTTSISPSSLIPRIHSYLGTYFPPPLLAQNRPRGIAYDEQKPNLQIPSIQKLGLVEDRVNKGWYVVKRFKKENPFRIQIQGKQLIWKSFGDVYPIDLKEVADFYRSLPQKRSLHINTGIHGKKEGIAFTDKNSGNFILQDNEEFAGRVSLHNVTSLSPPYTHQMAPHLDILDAWCHSAKTQDFRFLKEKTAREKEIQRIIRGSVPIEHLFNSFRSTPMDFPSKLAPNTKYVEIPNLKQDILKALSQYSFCYLQGMGAMGKSRIAWQIEQEKKGSSDASTVFITMKSSADIENFLNHARQQVRNPGSTEDILLKYFDQLGALARENRSKTFIVIDNIDSFDDQELFSKLYRSLKKQHQSKADSPFTVLVTGRREIEGLLEEYGLHPSETTIKIEDYCNNEKVIWQIFYENFLQQISPPLRKEAEAYLNLREKKITATFKDFHYHVGYTLLYAIAMGLAFNWERIPSADEYLDTRAKENKLLHNPNLLNDYGIPSIVMQTLKSIDKYHEGKASKIYEVLALISDGYVPYTVLKSILNEYYKENPIDSTLLQKILGEFEKAGMIRRNFKDNTMSMTPFYNKVICNNLSSQYLEKKEEIELLISTIFQKVDQSEATLQSQRESLSLLLSLFNYASKLNDQGKLAELISRKTISSAANLLRIVRYGDLQEKFRHFFPKLMGLPGYSFNQSFSEFLKGQNFEERLEDLIEQIDTELKEKDSTSTPFTASVYTEILDFAKDLNNLYVFFRAQNKEPQMKRAKGKLREIYYRFPTTPLGKILQYNISTGTNTEDLVIFPEIKFREISEKKRQKAEEWRKQNSPFKGNAVNLQYQELDEGLRILFQDFEDNGITDIDLSHNSLGWDSHDISPVCDLVKSSSKLRILKLKNNSLYKGRNFYMFVESLKLNRSIETLILNNNSMSDLEIQMLCEALRKHPKITYLFLDQNKFTNTGLEMLEQLMRDRPNIKMISTGLYIWNHHDGTKALVRDEKGNPQRDHSWSAARPTRQSSL